jgi:hypothetical protein
VQQSSGSLHGANENAKASGLPTLSILHPSKGCWEMRVQVPMTAMAAFWAISRRIQFSDKNGLTTCR